MEMFCGEFALTAALLDLLENINTGKQRKCLIFILNVIFFVPHPIFPDNFIEIRSYFVSIIQRTQN